MYDTCLYVLMLHGYTYNYVNTGIKYMLFIYLLIFAESAFSQKSRVPVSVCLYQCYIG